MRKEGERAGEARGTGRVRAQIRRQVSQAAASSPATGLIRRALSGPSANLIRPCVGPGRPATGLMGNGATRQAVCDSDPEPYMLVRLTSACACPSTDFGPEDQRDPCLCLFVCIAGRAQCTMGRASLPSIKVRCGSGQ